MDAQHHYLSLIVCLAVCYAAAWIGSAVTRPAIKNWYEHLAKPSWRPPNWAFAPAWTIIFTLMAFSAWLIWLQHETLFIWPALCFFGIQLALNIAWSAIFFGLRRLGLAAIEIACLWAAILGTLIQFWRIAPLAGWLLIPYLAWVSFAMVLNLAIWRMNSRKVTDV
ncbi:MAG TPA: TspO/MBR family protein [Candidatus Acidoferrales bacterium]